MIQTSLKVKLKLVSNSHKNMKGLIFFPNIIKASLNQKIFPKKHFKIDRI